jgi:hypothetical protein
MSPIEFKSAYYIKLGKAEWDWESDSISTGKLRLGWRQQSIDDINRGRWQLIEQQLRAKDEGRRISATTSDLKALMTIASSGADDIWVTFHQTKLWWAQLEPGPIEADDVSKFRRTLGPWHDRAIDGRLLAANALPGKIAQLQGFRATVCRVKYPDLLRRTINATPSPLAAEISRQRESLAEFLASAIKELHWKDFETLVDLVFRNAGWRRISVLGQLAKGYDLELREPITEAHYVVQVKSRAGLSDLQTTIENFSSEDYQRVYFVVHSPDDDLVNAATIPEHVDIVSPRRLADLALDSGLVDWIEEKTP